MVMEKSECVRNWICLMLLFVFSWPKCCGVRIERNTISGDIFEKGDYSLENDRGRVVVDGNCNVDGKGSASENNRTHCRCGNGQTFHADNANEEPKCMKQFGQTKDDLGCRFRIESSPNVKALNPQSTSQSIGSISYLRYNNLRSMKLKTSFYWNLTWQPVQLFFVDKIGNLKWISYNDTVAREYRGLLFKLDLEGQYQKGNEWKRKNSCLLLKMTGTRSYPLPAPMSRQSTSSVIVQSSTVSSHSSTTSFISLSTSSIQSSSALKPSIHPETTSSFIKTMRLGTTQTIKRYTTSSVVKSETSLISSTTAYELHSVRHSRHLQTAKPTFSVVKEPKSSISSILLTSTVEDNQGGSSHKRKSKDSQAGLIAGVTVAAILFAVATIAFFILCRRRFPSKGSSNNRKETLTLNLTDNTFNNEIYANDFKGDSQGNKDQYGNPLYDDQLRLKPRTTNAKPSMNDHDYARYDKPKNDLLAEPIYREVEDEGPIYQEADSVYQPVNKADINSPDTYQPIDTTTLPRTKPADNFDPVQSPIYQVLEESNEGGNIDPVQSPIYNVLEEETNTGECIDPVQSPIYQVVEEEPNNGFVEDSLQSPIYQVVNPEVYEELNQNGGKPLDDVYTGLDATTMNGPKQEPFYQEITREYGEINSKFDHDEEEV